MTDIRVTKTKSKLYRALGQLLRENEFDRITVSDIVKEAKVTRKTFYNHYQDKIELVQEYQMILSEKIRKLQMSHSAFDYDFYADLFTLLDRQDPLLIGLMSARGSELVQEIMKGTMAAYCRESLAYKNEDPVLLNYQSIMMANVIFGVVRYWLTTGKKTSPEETARILCKLRFPL